MTRAAATLVFQPDHPASRGHFAGNPIIPGAVLLSETLLALARLLGPQRMPIHVSSAKFLRPTRPGDRVLIEYSSGGRGEIRFACAVDGRPVLTGEMSCPNPPTAP